jgi:IS5 family transposase
MKPKKTDMVEVDLLDFIRNCKRLAKQALGTDAGKPVEGGLARWKHLVIHGYRLEDGHSYRETENRLRCFSELREILELDLNDVPDYSTIYKSFDRFNMTVWRALLRVSAEQLPQSGHVALDSTFFERGHASSYYLQRSDRDVQTLKVTTLTDTESLAVLDLQCSVEWKHDTRLGPQVVRRNADDLLSVAADKGFQDWMSKFEFYTLDVDPLVLERGSSPETVGHNALIREAGYSQRWMSETSYSTTKRSLGPAVRARFWYREFREIVLMFAISNIEQLCEPL